MSCAVSLHTGSERLQKVVEVALTLAHHKFNILDGSFGVVTSCC